MFIHRLLASCLVGTLLPWAQATLRASQTNSTITVTNDRLHAVLSKSNGRITTVNLDGTSLLGTGTFYHDCNCVLSGFYTPGADNTTLITGSDTEDISYAGIITRHTNKATGQYFEKSWWIRDGETDIHHFTRTAYWNASVPNYRPFGELRTLFRPSKGIFTHLSSNQDLTAPLPSDEAIAKQVEVQDATWYFGNTPNDPFVKEVADYWTKYTFSVSWRGHKAHGLFADGSTTGGKTFGAWQVMNTIDTYFGGPTHGDLVVDGIVYDYMLSNHFGNSVPNITHGMDRTYGPTLLHLNSGGTIDELRQAAEDLADPERNAAFYDSIAEYVPGYVPSAGRGSFSAKVTLPSGATRPVAILSQNGVSYQDNVFDTKAYQYWGEVDGNGEVRIPRVKSGTYRLTIYADGVFGEFIQDNITVAAGKATSIVVNWAEPSAGQELWRIGTPDKSSGEFFRGDSKDAAHPRHFPERSIYWGAYDFPNDFPNGINYTVGRSTLRDINYVHWSTFGPTYKRSSRVIEKVSNWTINFELDTLDFSKNATFTVQFAGVKTASGNTDVPAGEHSDVELKYYWNEAFVLSGVIDHTRSGSCAVRSQTVCYQSALRFTFPGSWLKSGWNKLVMALPYNTGSVFVQYDALRLELE